MMLINGISSKHNVQNTTAIKVIYIIFRLSRLLYMHQTRNQQDPLNPSLLTVAIRTAVTRRNNDFAPYTLTEVTNKFDPGIRAPAYKIKHTFDELEIV
ncbi:MAG TPA: hypothetical protein VFI70_00835 [Nitrososphaeraceae archaeon]|nr:hypothetical protein [Nitrososphaeraceae archaeon]